MTEEDGKWNLLRGDNPYDYPNDPEARRYIGTTLADQQMTSAPAASGPRTSEPISPQAVKIGLVLGFIGAIYAQVNGGPWYAGAIGGFLIGYNLKRIVMAILLGLIALGILHSMRDNGPPPSARQSEEQLSDSESAPSTENAVMEETELSPDDDDLLRPAIPPSDEDDSL